MKEAHDHHRVSPEGRELGELTARFADAECASLAAQGEPDERCKTCAFRAGTVPNGCLQTQSDAIKAITDDVPFLCHAHKNSAGTYDQICYGWFAARRIAIRYEKSSGEKLPTAPWDFSPSDEAPA